MTGWLPLACVDALAFVVLEDVANICRMKWVHENVAALLSAIVVTWVLVVLLRAAVISARRRGKQDPVRDFERSEAVRQQIQRKITERRATRDMAPDAASEPRSPASPRRSGVPPLDPFGGPARRWWMRLREWFGASRPRR